MEQRKDAWIAYTDASTHFTKDRAHKYCAIGVFAKDNIRESRMVRALTKKAEKELTNNVAELYAIKLALTLFCEARFHPENSQSCRR